jgi:hypothetical protein
LPVPASAASIAGMNKLVIVTSLALASPALAGGKEGSLGVGAEAELNGQVAGVSVNYDGGLFHVGGVLGYGRVKPDNAAPGVGASTTFMIGARFFYHVHSAGQADFGVGGAVGLADVPNGNNGHNAHLFLEPGFQIRAFITPNVALSFGGGIVIGTVDANSLAISGGSTIVTAGSNTISLGVEGILGAHYYFY